MSGALSLFEHLGEYVFTWSWQVAVLVIVAWIAVRFDRRHRQRLRHSLWVSTLLFGLLLPWLPERIAAQSWTREIRQIFVEPKAAPSKPFVETWGSVSSVPQGTMGTAQAPGASHVGTIGRSEWSFSRAALLQAAGLFWMVGVLIAACRRMREYLRLRRIASNAAVGADESTPPIRLSSEVRSPMLFGWLRPVVLLPDDVATWSTPTERAIMVRHESVHYARKDHWIAGFESLARTVFFFHPLVRWTCRQVDIERELVCDEEVLRRGIEPEIYAEAILKVAEHAFAGKASCGVYFSGAGQLDRRIDLLFRPPRRVSRSAVLLFPVFLLLTPMAGLGFWQARVEALAPIEFRIQVNPIGLIPEEILAPPVVPIAAVIPRAVLRQDPPVNSAAPATPLPPRVNVAFLKINKEEVMATITLGLPDSQLAFKEDTAAEGMPIRRASGRIEGQITNLTGKVITAIEDRFEVMALAKDFNPTKIQVYQKTIVLLPGLYRMFVLLTDSNSGTTATIDTRLEVPRFPSDKLAASSLILADVVEPVPLASPSDAFRIGSLRVRPSMTELGRDRDLNIFQQVYVAAADVGSTLPVHMETLVTLDGREIKRVAEQLQRAPTMAITKKIPLADFTPGVYSIQTSYTDAATGERVVSTGEFTVK